MESPQWRVHAAVRKKSVHHPSPVRSTAAVSWGWLGLEVVTLEHDGVVGGWAGGRAEGYLSTVAYIQH